jgi:hypothetical protein
MAAQRLKILTDALFGYLSEDPIGLDNWVEADHGRSSAKENPSLWRDHSLVNTAARGLASGV